MPGKFDFAPEMELSILRLMARDLPFLAFSSDLLKPEYFDTEALQWYFVQLRDFYQDHRTKIDPASLKNELKKSFLAGEIDEFTSQPFVDIFKALWDSYVPNLSYIQAELTRFACKQAMIQAVKSAPELLSDDKFDDLTSAVIKANDIRRVAETGSHNYFADFSERWRKIEEDDESMQPIPTGIPHLDQLLRNGGLSPKELGVVMAPPGRGKSNFLINAGKRAVYAGKRVFHVTLEMSYEKVAARYDSAFSGIRANLLKSSLDSLDAVYQSEENLTFKTKIKPLRRKIEQLAKTFKDALIIKEYPTRTAPVSMVESEIESLRAKGFKPDILLLDYADIMKATSKYNNRWEEQGAIYEEVRGLAVKHRIPIWTGCQANRASMSKQIIRMEDIADSFEKAKIADVILGLCQTEEEKEDNIMRIFVAKNRDAAGGQELVIRNDYAHMQFHAVSPDDFRDDAIKNQKEIINSYKNRH